MPRTLILALGNPLRGDDGVGLAVLDVLHAAPPTGATLCDGGTAGLETAVLLQGYARLIILDAADFGAAPGSWRRFEYAPELLPAQPELGGTLHNAGLAEALQLAAALNVLPAQTIIFAVQPQEIGWEAGLSPPVRAVVPAVAAAVSALVSA